MLLVDCLLVTFGVHFLMLALLVSAAAVSVDVEAVLEVRDEWATGLFMFAFSLAVISFLSLSF